ncbi:hypothetical protein ACROYT_G024666 [Oculina patagonica]
MSGKSRECLYFRFQSKLNILVVDKSLGIEDLITLFMMNRLVILLLVAVAIAMLAAPSEGGSGCFGACPSWCSSCRCICYPTWPPGSGVKCDWSCDF